MVSQTARNLFESLMSQIPIDSPVFLLAFCDAEKSAFEFEIDGADIQLRKEILNHPFGFSSAVGIRNSESSLSLFSNIFRLSFPALDPNAFFRIVQTAISFDGNQKGAVFERLVKE